jgi:glycerol-3-phosphate dehydrogenase
VELLVVATLDAASRGQRLQKKVILLRTSIKSTKLIHGGLRYLKNNLIFWLVKVGSRTRSVHKLAPHLSTT